MTYQSPNDPTQPAPYAPGHGYDQQPITTLGAPMPPPKNHKPLPWIIGGVVAFVLVCCGGLTAIGTLAGDPEKKDAIPAAAVASTPAAKPSSVAPTTKAPAPAKTTAAPKPQPKPKVTFKGLSERQWKLVAKNPDNYIGKTYIVYGTVTQFDSATGDDTFLASVAHRNLAEDYEYDINTMLTGEASKLTNLVEDDEFRATVTVMGSFSYDTQIGGNTTVPLLQVSSIRVL